jgi:transposase
MYPLITNCEGLSPEDVLVKHKYQPTLEKRHEQLKTVYSVAPTFLKNEGRVEALLLLYYAALLVQALIERQLRNAMNTRELSQIPLYPEERECRSPTARKVLDAFAALQRHHLWNGTTLERIFEPNLSLLQRQLLDLLGVPDTAYTAQKPR